MQPQIFPATNSNSMTGEPALDELMRVSMKYGRFDPEAILTVTIFKCMNAVDPEDFNFRVRNLFSILRKDLQADKEYLRDYEQTKREIAKMLDAMDLDDRQRAKVKRDMENQEHFDLMYQHIQRNQTEDEEGMIG